MNVYEISFSATGRTKQVLQAFSASWELPKKHIDLTKQDFDGSRYTFSPEDLCIVAAGVYGGRIPAPAAQRLKSLNGNGANTILLAVYGNRAIDDALLEMKDILEQQGFRCRAAAEAVAEHSMMPQFGAGRPDAQDRKELAAFAADIKAGLETGALSESVAVPGKHPYVGGGSMPIQIKCGKACVQCGACAARCPTGAISAENSAVTDPKKCILCMRCTTVCPQKARKLPGWTKILSPVMATKLGGRKENKLYL